MAVLLSFLEVQKHFRLFKVVHAGYQNIIQKVVARMQGIRPYLVAKFLCASTCVYEHVPQIALVLPTQCWPF